MAEPVQEVYVGPRPFERSERNLFFGRDREISELLSLVVSSRVVLCYAPSGAGKTSLMNAGLQPRLEREGFEVLPSTRVRGMIPEGVDQSQVSNVYIFNALLSLAGNEGKPAELAGRSLAEHMAMRPHRTDEDGFPAPRILIFDQFEELLTSYPERWQEREGFFNQVREALQADPLLRVVFIMREDFLARIEPYIRLLKPHQQARFRLALLGPEGAQAAVTGPLRGTGRHFKEGVVAALIEELLKVRVETAQGEPVEVVGEHVEPVQLQVVCRNLWTSLPPDVQEISPEHLKAYGDVDQALRDFYESCLAQAKASLNANEPDMRQWFEQQLITPAGTRGIVFRDATRTADLPNPVVDFLENRHLIRGEWRAGSRWYELTHDRFIEPIQRANERWRVGRQAQRNRWILAVGGALFMVLLLLATTLTFQGSASQVSGVSTAVAATIVIESTNALATAQFDAYQVAQEDIALSKSRQLAAEALLEDDPDLALLLGIEANRIQATQEARRSLHKILSKQAVIDGHFLREFDPEIIAPALVTRLDNNGNSVVSIAFSPDGRRFVSGGERGTLMFWDMSTDEPISRLLMGSKGNILSVVFSPDGKLVASAGVDGQIRLWDAATGKPFGTPLLGHSGLVSSLAFSPDGSRLASGGDDNIVRIWAISAAQSRIEALEPETGTLLAEALHPDDVWSLAWSPDGKYLASGGGGNDKIIRLWETETFSEVRELKGHRGLVRTVAWSPDGRTLASGSIIGQDEATDGEVILWDTANGEIITRPLLQNVLPVRAVTFDPTGKLLAIGRYDGTITLWDTSKRQPLPDPFKAHSLWVMSLAFSPDGRFIVSGSIDKTIALWDLAAPTRSVALSSDGKLLATSQGSAISLWDLSTASTTPLRILSGHTEDVLALAFSPDGSLLVSAGRDDTVLLWDVSTGQQLHVLTSQQHTQTIQRGDVLTLAFSPDGSILASGNEDGLITLWNLDNLTEMNSVRLESAVRKVLFYEDGNTLGAVGEDGVLTTMDVISGATHEILPAGQAGAGIASVALTSNGKKIAFSQEVGSAFLPDNRRAHGIEISSFDDSFDPTVKPDDIDFIVIRASSGRQRDPNYDEFLERAQVVPIRGAWHFFSLDVPWQEQADVFLSAVKDKGFHFFILDLEVSSEDGSTTFLSDAEQWLKYVDERVEQKILLQTTGPYLTSFGSAGDWMKEWPHAVAQYPFEPDRNGNPFLPKGIDEWKIWQYSEGRGKGAEYGVGTDSVYLAMYNGTPLAMWEWLDITSFAIYDPLSGELIRPKQDVRVSALNGIAFSPDGSYVAAGGDGMVSLLSAETGEEITTLNLAGRKVLSLSFATEDMLAIGMEDGTVLLWDLSLLQKDTDVQPALDIACSQANRNLTDSEWGQFFGDSAYSTTCQNLPAP